MRPSMNISGMFRDLLPFHRKEATVMKSGKKGKRVLAAALAMLTVSAFPAYAAENAGAQTVYIGYENLGELIRSGNPDILETKTDLSENIRPYEEMKEDLEEDRKYMEAMAESYEDDGNEEMAEFYESNADLLEKSISQVGITIRNMKSYSQEKNLEDQADLYTKTAQTLMNSYNQTMSRYHAAQKSLEAAQASWDETQRKYAAGLVKETEAESAGDRVLQAETSAAALLSQAEELKSSLLLLLGISSEAETEIGEIPEPDVEAIRTVNYEEDKETAVSNNSNLFETRRAEAKGTDERELREKKIETAEAEAEMAILTAYENLQTTLLEYEAALQAYEAAKLDYEALQRKEQAGLLSHTEYLEGEAEYAEQEALRDIAAMQLSQSYESYLWEVRGV